jgi:hypothetical protein
MPNDRDVEAPISLMGLWGSEEDDDGDGSGTAWENTAEEQQVLVSGASLRVRQYCFHEKNANRVWPGTFNLVEYYLSPSQPGDLQLLIDNGPVLELGTATGLLAVRLAMEGVSVVTSDYDDSESGAESIENNVVHNFELNGQSERRGRHVPHTWGTGWDAAKNGAYKIVLASDILLYTAVYGDLVVTINELFDAGTETFVMSWDRRMEESKEFFALMKDNGYDCMMEPKCIFVFTRKTLK